MRKTKKTAKKTAKAVVGETQADRLDARKQRLSERVARLEARKQRMRDAAAKP
jgi:hypothetical protein